MIVRLVIYAVSGIMLALFLWFLCQVLWLGLVEFFRLNGQKQTYKELSKQLKKHKEDEED